MQWDGVSRNLDQRAYWRAVGEISARWLNRYAVSPNHQRVAFVDRQDGREVLTVDGKKEGLFDQVYLPWFSPDSRRVAFSARIGSGRFIVVDGVESQRYEAGSDMYPIFSPDSQRIAFMARRTGSELMVIDGVEGKPYANLNTASPPKVFSPNSKRVAYAAQTKAGKWVAVVDGAESEPADKVDSLLFSPDSQHLIYRAVRGSDSFVVLDGVEGPAFAGVEIWVGKHGCFSPDGKRSAYLVRTKLGEAVVVDGQPGAQHKEVDLSSLVFSPDSRRFAYAARTDSTAFVVVDGKEGPHYDCLEETPLFSSDGKHLAYVAMRAGKTFVVLDGAEGPLYWKISQPVFSPDSRHLAYAAFHGLTATVLLDGKEGPQHTLGNIEGSGIEILFSPDSRRMAYRILIAGKAERVVVDGVESKLYERVEGGVSFSPDSKHLAYWASPFSGKWYVVVDGHTTAKYTRVLEHTRPIFDGSDSLHALAVRGEEVVLLQIKIPMPSRSESK